jgi:hypothetical protein
VVLSIDEYQALRDRSRAVGPPVPNLPVDGTPSRVEYDLHIDGETITGRGVLTVDVLRDGWARIPIPAGLIVSDARVDGAPAALVEGAPPYVLLSRTGRTVVSLDLVVPLVAAAGTESISLPASPASVTKTTLLLPRSNVDLSLTGGLVTDHAESTTESRWTVYGRPNEPLKLAWKHRVDDRRSALPLRARARITEVAGFSEDLCQVSASVHVEVVQGATQDVALSLPQGLVVNEVNGPTVDDWQSSWRDGLGSVRAGEVFDAVRRRRCHPAPNPGTGSGQNGRILGISSCRASPLKWRLWDVRRSRSSLAGMVPSGFLEFRKASRPSWRRFLDSTRLPRTLWSAISEPGLIFK